MSQGKSGFEIRADLLNQAQGLLEGNIYRSNEAIVTHNDTFPTIRNLMGINLCQPKRLSQLQDNSTSL